MSASLPVTGNSNESLHGSDFRLNHARWGRLKSSPLLLLMPSAIWYIFFLIIPIGIIFLFSFMHKGHYGRIIYELDLTNYSRVLEVLYLRMVGRSLLLATGTTICCFLLGFPLAYVMARSPEQLKKILLGLVIVPFWTNFIIRVYALKLLIGDSGLLNRWLLDWGIIKSPLIMTNNQVGIAIGMLYNYLPFMILPLYVALEKFDFTLLDAAYDLGANKIQTLWKILLPLSLPGIATGAMFVFIPAFGEFVIPDLLGGSQSMYVGNLITETFLKNHDWPFGSAISSLLVLLTMLAFLLTSPGGLLRRLRNR
jgi:spermidine/putrescine transport system permease protein